MQEYLLCKRMNNNNTIKEKETQEVRGKVKEAKNKNKESATYKTF